MQVQQNHAQEYEQTSDNNTAYYRVATKSYPAEICVVVQLVTIILAKNFIEDLCNILP